MTHLDRINVIDIEATCWENKPPVGEQNEIIEIGITIIDVNDFEVIKTDSILVKPLYSKVSEFCTNLTTITQGELDKNGIFFAEAVNMLKKEYKTRDYLWASWGDYDRVQFERNCKLYANHDKRIEEKYNKDIITIDMTQFIELEIQELSKRIYPFGRRHINVKTLFSIINNLEKEIGVEEALEILGMKFEGTLHRGGDDSYHIAKILCKTLSNSRTNLRTEVRTN